jgi:hypothetical protein
VQAFARGELYQQGEAWNLGVRLGLPGIMSLAPLIGVWAIAVVIWWRLSRNEPQELVSGDLKPASAAHVH